MADKLTDVLDSARVLADGGIWTNGDIKIKAYPESKVRIFVVKNKLDVMIAGDATPSDKEDSKRVVGQHVTQAKVDAVLSAVSQFASAAVKPPAKSVAQPA